MLKKHRRLIIAVTVTLLVAAVIGYYFRAETQRRLVLKYAAPYVEKIALDYIHLTPWSLDVAGAEVVYRGGKFHVGKAEARFGLLALLRKTLDVRSLDVSHTDIDISRFAPPPGPATPFPGVLAPLDTGYGLRAEGVALTADVVLNDHQVLTLRLHGGGVDRGRAGHFNVAAKLGPPGAPEQVAAKGTLDLAERDDGSAGALDAHLSVTLQPAPDAAPIPLKIEAGVMAGDRPPPAPPANEGDEPVPLPAPETVRLVVTQYDEVGEMRVTAHVDGVYTGVSGSFAGGYHVSANERLIAPSGSPLVLPALAADLDGKLQATLQPLGVESTLTSTIGVKSLDRVLGAKPKLPGELKLESIIELALHDATLDVTRFDSALTDDESRGILNAALKAPLAIPLADPKSFLMADRALLWLKITGIPLDWLSPLAPGLTVGGGVLKADLDLLTTKKGTIRLLPSAPATLAELEIGNEAGAILTAGNATFNPKLSVTPEHLWLRLDDLVFNSGDQRLLSGLFHVTVPRLEAPRRFGVTSQAKLEVDPLLALPGVAPHVKGVKLPAGLSASYDAKIDAANGAFVIQALKATIAGRDRPKLAEVTAKQKFRIEAGAGGTWKNPQGELAAIAVQRLQLEWLNPFMPPYELEGELANASFTLSAAGGDALTLSAAGPLEVQGLGLREGKQVWLRGLTLSLEPELTYSPAAYGLSYTDLTLGAGRGALVLGAGTASMAVEKTAAGMGLGAKGRLEMRLNGLARQPILAQALPRPLPKQPLVLKLDYELAQKGAACEFASLKADLLADGAPVVRLAGSPGLRVQPLLAKNETYAHYVIGAATLEVEKLSSLPLSVFLGDTPRFASLDGKLAIESDGTLLHASTVAPLVVRELVLADGAPPPFQPLTATIAGKVTARGQTLSAGLEGLALAFAGHEADPAVKGRLAFDLDGTHTVPLQKLLAELEVSLPQLLDQQAILPGHKLRAGRLATKIVVEPSGNIHADTNVRELAAAEPLAIATIDMPADGHMSPDGKGFEFQMAFNGDGDSGPTKALIATSYAPQAEGPGLFKLDFKSERFYLNDMLALRASIRRPPAQVSAPAPEQAAAPTSPVVLDETPDARAFWDKLPWAAHVNLDAKRVYYTDYIILRGIQGKLDVFPDHVSLRDFAMRFHDSPITFDGAVAFDKANAEPYDVKLTGKVEDFDLNTFFTELVPGNKPQIEGLFGMDVSAFGRSPNAAQFRNHVLFDIRMQSRDGLFRPLPPDSTLLIASSGILGIIGEGLSYVPTDGFGAGALSRLVNYIQEINYDTVDIHVLRDDSRAVKVEQFVVRSPTIAMTATGGIGYVPGKDILSSPLELTGNLDMVGRGAAILYSMDLLKPERDALGYWKGPEFRIWGTPSATESNFDDIIQAASSGTVKGAFFRPLAGLIGNIRYRWLGEEIKREAEAPQLEKGSAAKVKVPEVKP
ncbi:MAG: hypothetical protein HY749_08200 [Gammaproteobacteria bacterium]|nr:hypothetical protein [Gammaproteobacteria bacterium]MBI5616451.1 hypothetical protein [Gammaproteobacteria bacterium]